MTSQASVTIRRHRWIIVIAVAVLLLFAAAYVKFFRPRYSTIHLASGETYDVIQVRRDDGIGALFGPRADGAGPALVIDYYSRAGNLSEAQRLQEYAVPIADSAGLRFIVVSQTTPTLTRWLPFVHGQMWAWRRWGTGNWRRLEQ